MERKELPLMAVDSVKLPSREKARDVLLRKMNEAIKEFEDETGLKVTTVHGSVNALEEDAELGDMSWRLTTEL